MSESLAINKRSDIDLSSKNDDFDHVYGARQSKLLMHSRKLGGYQISGELKDKKEKRVFFSLLNLSHTIFFKGWIPKIWSIWILEKDKQ